MRHDEDKIVPDDILDSVPKTIEALHQVVDPLDITPAETTKTDPYVKAPTVLPGLALTAAKPGARRACPSPHLTAMGEATASAMAPSGEDMPARCFLAHRDCGE